MNKCEILARHDAPSCTAGDEHVEVSIVIVDCKRHALIVAHRGCLHGGILPSIEQQQKDSRYYQHVLLPLEDK